MIFGPLNPIRQRVQGYTLIEMLVSMSIFSLVILGILGSLVTLLRKEHDLNNRMTMISDGQHLASFLRSTTRLSRINEMVMYPQEAPFIALSYPIPEGQFHTENEFISEDGSLLWGQTLIVHAYPVDNPTELRLTRFRPRDLTLSASEREQQLEDVTLNGNGQNTLNGLNSETRTLAEMESEFSFRPDGGTYNFYSASPDFEKHVVLGGVRLQSGANTLKFRSKSKSSGSSGYGLKIDKLFLSPAGLAVEAESLLPVVSSSGATAVAESNMLGSWSDQQVLSFPAGGVGAEMALTYFNDTWFETLFLGGGSELIHCVTGIEEESESVGTLLRPSGRDPAWFGGSQAGAEGVGLDDDSASGVAVRVVIKGDELEQNGFILTEGDGITVRFAASDVPNKSLRIQHAYIAEASSEVDPGPDILTDSSQRLQFGEVGSPANAAYISTGETVDTVPVDFAIDPDKSYVISYWVSGTNAQEGNPWHYTHEGSATYTYILPLTSSPNEADLRSANWSSREDLQTLSGILGVDSIETTYVNEGIYISRIVDTTLSAPTYHDLNWEGIFPEDTTAGFQVRTGNQMDMSDAPDWEDVDSIYTTGALSVSPKRYVQVRIVLSRNRVLDQVPELKSFTLRWWGDPAYVDLGGDFQKFSAGGTIEFFVNDTPPISTLRADLRLTTAGKSKTDLGDTWKLTVETTPRN
mgnify:CR=1 FL=1